MPNVLEHGYRVSATATHGSAATASITGISGVRYYAVSVSASSDKAGSILLVKDGTTVIWQVQVGVGSVNVDFPFGLPATSGNLISAEIDGTSACKANILAVAV